MEVQQCHETKEIEFASIVDHIFHEMICTQHHGGYSAMTVTENTKNRSSKKRPVFGVIKDNRLVGLYHEKDYCPKLLREQAQSNGTIQQLHRKVARTNQYYCRHCIYLTAEEQEINCFTICPQQVCIQKETIPEEMRKEMQEVTHGRKNPS